MPKVREPNDTSNFDAYPDSEGETAGRVSGADQAASFADIEKAFDVVL